MRLYMVYSRIDVHVNELEAENSLQSLHMQNQGSAPELESITVANKPDPGTTYNAVQCT